MYNFAVNKEKARDRVKENEKVKKNNNNNKILAGKTIEIAYEQHK